MIEILTVDVSELDICTAINSKLGENWHEQKMLKHIPNLKKVDHIQKLLTLVRRYCVATIDKLEIKYCSQTQIGEFFPLTRIRTQYMTSKYICHWFWDFFQKVALIELFFKIIDRNEPK